MKIGRYQLINNKFQSVVNEPVAPADKFATVRFQASIVAAFMIVTFYLLLEPMRVYAVWLLPDIDVSLDQNWSNNMGTTFTLAIGFLLGRHESNATASLPPVYANPIGKPNG